MRKCLRGLCAAALALMLPAAGGAEPLFEPANPEGIYNYCPSAFVENGVTHIYYCTNTKGRDVVDSIGYRQAEEEAAFSDERIVLEHKKSWQGWDCVHVCDPDVIKGSFNLDGEEYAYLMVYLGCDSGNNQGNEIGLAVAKTPEGPFIKTEALNPFVAFERDLSTPEKKKIFQWGVGQASLVSMDKHGRVMLIYTSGTLNGTGLVCEKWDLSDLNNPRPLGEMWKTAVPNTGVIGRDGRPATLNNADFVYDPREGTLYLVAEGAPCYLEGIDIPGTPTFVSSTVRVMKYSQMCAPDEMEAFFAPNHIGGWTLLDLIEPEESGYPRNHNAGILADPYGWLLEADTLPVLYSVSEVNQPSDSLWTYRIHRMDIPLGGK